MKDFKPTERQRYVLNRLVEGAKIIPYLSSFKYKLCFKSDEDGLGSILYLSIPMRRLAQHGLILCYLNDKCVVTKKGLVAIRD